MTISKAGFALARGAEELLTVTLQPTQAGSISETLELQSNDPLHPSVQVPLRAMVSASGGRPSLVLDASALSFGQVALGETSEFILPVRNAGTATLTISNVVADNTQVVASPTSLTVAPQETRSLTVRFRPMPGGARSGKVTLFSNDAVQPQVGVNWSATEVKSPFLAVTSLKPADGSFNVGTKAEIQLTFSEPLFSRRAFTALDAQLIPEPLSGPIEEALQVRGDGRTVVIPVQLAQNQVYRLVIYGATGQSGLELFDMVESTFSTGSAAPVVASLSGSVVLEGEQSLTGSVYLFDAGNELVAQANVALNTSFEVTGIAEGSYTLYVDGVLADGRPVNGSYDRNGDGAADVVSVKGGVSQADLRIVPVVLSGTRPTVSSAPVQADLDSTRGNQHLTLLSAVRAGQQVVLEVYASSVEQLTGAGVTVRYDTSKVWFAGGEEGEALLKQNGGTALFLSSVDPLGATVEFGGAIMGPTAATAVSGGGLVGRFRFAALEGFSGSTDLQVTHLVVKTLSGLSQTDLNLVATLSSGAEPTYPEGPITMDLNLASGDQKQRTGGSATVGKQYTVQLLVTGAPEIRGWSARIEYDPLQVRYVSGSFAPSSFIPGLIPLVQERTDSVSVGGTVLSKTVKPSGDATLGTVKFEVLAGFTGRTDLVITRTGLNRVDTGEQFQRVHSMATLIREATAGSLKGDFSGDGQVNFSDFFLFADAFGGSDPQYDLNGDGQVNFSDFFIFADAFGGAAKAKLLSLAHDYLGLPLGSTLEPNYPNPFNLSTTIGYALPAPSEVRLVIYSLIGQPVRVLVQDRQEGGHYQVAWDGKDEQGELVSSGVYLYRLVSPGLVETRRMLLLK